MIYSKEKIMNLVHQNVDKLTDEYGMNCLEQAEKSGISYVNNSYDIDLSSLTGYVKADDMPEYLTIELPDVLSVWSSPYDWIYDKLRTGDVDESILLDNYKVKDNYNGSNDDDIVELCGHVDWDKVKREMLYTDRQDIIDEFLDAVNDSLAKMMGTD